MMRTDIVGTQYEGNTAIPIKANKYFVKGNRILYRLDNNALDHRSAGTAVSYPLNVLQTKLAYDLDQWQRRLERVRESIQQLQSIAGEEWGKDADLAKLKQQLADLDKRIKRSLDSTSAEQVQQKTDDRLPVKFEKRGRDHVAIWHRDLFPLVTTDDMREVIDQMRGWGYLRDTEWRDGRSQPREELEAEFGTSKNAADFIEKLAQLQKEREVKQAA